MSLLNYASPDKRVNQQVSANKLTSEIRVSHFINLKVEPISANIPNQYYPDLDDVKLVSCETLSAEIKEEEKEYFELMKEYGFKPVVIEGNYRNLKIFYPPSRQRTIQLEQSR